MKKYVRLLANLFVLGISVAGLIAFRSATIEFFIALGCAILMALIEIFLDQHERPTELDPVATLYRILMQSKCDVVRTLAESKYADTRVFYENLSKGRIPLTDETDVYQILDLLFCDIPVVKVIHATSYGELDDWRDGDSWWVKSYIRTQAVALKQKKHVTRVFILRADEQDGRAVDVLQANADLGITVKTVAQQSVSSQDFNLANNCLIFCDRNKKPIYCFQAVHDKEGHFANAILFMTGEGMQPIVEAYSRIDRIAQKHVVETYGQR